MGGARKQQRSGAPQEGAHFLHGALEPALFGPVQRGQLLVAAGGCCIAHGASVCVGPVFAWSFGVCVWCSAHRPMEWFYCRVGRTHSHTIQVGRLDMRRSFQNSIDFGKATASPTGSKI
jgi:hypothetical protein